VHLLSIISNFLLSTWFFSITYNWFHIMINTCILIILLQLILRMDFTRAVMLSFSAHFFAFIVYSIIAISLFLNYVVTHYMPTDVSETSRFDDIFLACLSTACVYSLLQSVFLLLMHIHAEFRLRRIAEIVWLSNGISAFLSYLAIITLILPQL
jgi:hypothetical protein